MSSPASGRFKVALPSKYLFLKNLVIKTKKNSGLHGTLPWQLSVFALWLEHEGRNPVSDLQRHALVWGPAGTLHLCVWWEHRDRRWGVRGTSVRYGVRDDETLA